MLVSSNITFDINKLFGIPHCPNPVDLELDVHMTTISA